MNEEQKPEPTPPSKGKYVKVIKGRKIPIGTIGRVFWVGDAYQYRWQQLPTRKVGIIVQDDILGDLKMYTNEKNVVVVEPDKEITK